MKTQVSRWRPAASLALLLALSLVASQAHAQLEGTYQVAIKKQEEKRASRWSLASWLEQKQQNRLMDMWLAQNSHSSPYEFFLQARSVNDARYLSATPEDRLIRNSFDGSFAAYAGIAGLRAGYEGDTRSRSSWNASFNLRLFGRALQDTHINLEYGFRGIVLTDDPTLQTVAHSAESFQNQFGGVSLDLYFTKNFGIEGSYRKMLPAKSDKQRMLEGETSEAGVFIDFSLLRVFGTWRKELLQVGDTPSRLSEFREGFGGGLRLYF